MRLPNNLDCWRPRVPVGGTILVLEASVMLLGLATVQSHSEGLSFAYGPVKDTPMLRVYEGAIPAVEGAVYVYATLGGISANPVGLAGGAPQWRGGSAEETTGGIEATVPAGFMTREQPVERDGRPQLLQTVVVGQATEGGIAPVLRFGLADDGRAGEAVHVTGWLSDGYLEYFAPYVRPATPYDFKARVDLKARRATVWVAGRGDGDWFLLADDVQLHGAASVVNAVRVEMYPDGPPITGLRVQGEPWPEGEVLKPHPQAKPERVVGPGRGFRFQAMRSTWRKPKKHVTIFRKPGVHAGFPDVALAGPGHLVCVWRNGSHTGGSGGLSMAHSYDGGQSWTEAVRVTDLPGNCPRLQRLRDGSLVLVVDVPSGPDQFTATWDLVLWDSTDGGETWVNERWLRTAEVGGGGCIVPSRICELEDGTWLLAASYFAKPPQGGWYVEILDYYRSRDRGKTWELVGQPYHFPPFCLSEPSPVLLPDGSLAVFARESRTDGMPGAKGYSRDGGRTWEYQELPHPITGRTCGGLLRDGRVMNTFRSGVGRAALRAWIGDPKDPTTAQPAGAHYNDAQSVGLRDGALHIDNDGACGQFTKYSFRPPDSAETTVEIRWEVKVVANAGRAATVSVPFAGRMRLFPDHVVFAHDSSLRIEVAPGKFHQYHVVSRPGSLQVEVDGRKALDTDRGDSRLNELPWTRASIYALEFGNEATGCGATSGDEAGTRPDVYPVNISREVTGYSLWRSFEVVLSDPRLGRRELSWVAARDGFPDQHQLDHMLEIEASANGHDQGYSGWVQLEDGRVFVVHYTDDAAPACVANPHMFGVPWIRGTCLEPEDLPGG